MEESSGFFFTFLPIFFAKIISYLDLDGHWGLVHYSCYGLTRIVKMDLDEREQYYQVQYLFQFENSLIDLTFNVKVCFLRLKKLLFVLKGNTPFSCLINEKL